MRTRANRPGGNQQEDLFGFTPAAAAVGKVTSKRGGSTGQALLKPGSAVHRRLLEASADIAGTPSEQIVFQHTVLCQTGMPYRNPGEGVRRWERRNGVVVLEIDAGRVMHPVRKHFVDTPLPFGARARLILIHLNGEALRTGSPEIEVEDSLSAFAQRILGRYPRGRDIRTFKEQLGALSTATVRLGVASGDRAAQLTGQIVEVLDLWAPADPSQRVLWPSTIQLGERYFASLTRHAVPLDERAVRALAHSAMGLDIYAWLAQRLHRMARGRPQLVPWTVLHEQFGQGYGRIRKFREVFLRTLTFVHGQYRVARVEVDQKGLTLRNSPPPVGPRIGASSRRAIPRSTSE